MTGHNPKEKVALSFCSFELPHRLVSPGARPTPASKEDVTSSLLLERARHAAEIHADGAKSHANKLKRKFAQVHHNRMEFTAKPAEWDPVLRPPVAELEDLHSKRDPKQKQSWWNQ